MKVNQLKLENFRCFQKLEIDFSPKLTVLVAENGGGKTAILDAIAVAFGPFIGAFDEAKGGGFSPDDAQWITDKEQKFPLTLDVEGMIQEKSIQWRRILTGKKSRTTISESKILIETGKKLQEHVRNLEEIALPLFTYYGTGRLWKQERLTLSRKQGWGSRTKGYTDALNPNSNFRSFKHWFQNTSYADFRAEEKDNPYEKALSGVRSAVNIVMESTGWENIHYSGYHLDVTMKHPDVGTLPVRLLSDGLRAMVGLTSDIAYRIMKLNPHYGENAPQETEGIVLIDEVDMHLHPSWQQHVLQNLGEAFPKIQFIVTTHSPQVLTTVAAQDIRIIRDGKIYAAPSGTEGAESSRVLKRVLGVDKRPPAHQATKELETYLKLVDHNQWDTPRAHQLRKILDQRYQGEEPALYKADLIIENRKWEMEDKGHKDSQ
ncbi:AAA family ATPase [Magnetococcales bacterium HHB-1]